MEDWDIPEQDDFEDRYADELEMLNEMDDYDDNRRAPGPRKSLVFPTPDKPADNEDIVSKNGVSQSIKRQIDEMYALLSDDDSEEEILNNENDVAVVPDSQAKRPRMSTTPERSSPDKLEVNLPYQTRNNQTPPCHSSAQISHSSPRVFTRPPIGKDCITLTGCDRGRRVYLSLNKDETLEQDKVDNKHLHNKRPTNLLGVPFSVLKERILEQKRIKLLEESKRITDSLNEVLNDDLMNGDKNDDNKDVDEVKGKGLWVDKYSPKTYVELLSDDGINRNFLSWLKLWDSVVFGKDKPKKKRKDEKQDQKKDKYNYHKEEDTKWMELDATGRPVCKIALLCGPPGLGKTTLAHIVAQHAGYSVVEMNASDDRSVDVFRNKIESATQMQSVLDSGKKPNCLIIDEIDGAPTPAINVLLSLIKKKDAEPTAQQKKKKRKKTEMLSRPVICICNDPYVPALRLLRQQAFVLTFPPTLSARLAQRLMQISRKEVLQTDMAALLALCDKAENDIRSCLNTLQFLRQKEQNLTTEFVQSATIGQKDTQKSLFSLWQAIFQLARQKKKRLALQSNIPTRRDNNSFSNMFVGDPTSHPEITSSAARFYNMLHLASSNGQYNKLENGIFENYLNMKFKDVHLNLVVSATEWLQFADLVSHCLLQQQNFVLMRYQPFLSVAFHMFFAGPSQPKLQYPSAGYENTLKKTKTLNTMSSMLNDVSPHLRGNLDVQIVAAEILPLLVHIITPTLRPVNTQLFSESEKKQFADLINTMISYNLTYHQERTMEGNYTYVLDPKVEDVVKFPGLPQHKQMTYATKQLIAREIDLEKMRRMEKVILGRNAEKESRSKEVTKGEQAQTNTSSSVVLHLKPKELKQNIDKQATDFFGQPVYTKSSENSDTLCRQNNPYLKSKSPFWFKFQEGFSNAVRRTVKIQDLL